MGGRERFIQSVSGSAVEKILKEIDRLEQSIAQSRAEMSASALEEVRERLEDVRNLCAQSGDLPNDEKIWNAYQARFQLDRCWSLASRQREAGGYHWTPQEPSLRLETLRSTIAIMRRTREFLLHRRPITYETFGTRKLLVRRMYFTYVGINDWLAGYGMSIPGARRLRNGIKKLFDRS